jgi:hypothetical protein
VSKPSVTSLALPASLEPLSAEHVIFSLIKAGEIDIDIDIDIEMDISDHRRSIGILAYADDKRRQGSSARPASRSSASARS